MAARITVADRVNKKWGRSDRGQQVTVLANRFISKHTKIFAMGSCFATEIRMQFRAHGYDVYPKYFDIKFDTASASIGRLPVRDTLNHFDTFLIRQEIERSVGLRPYKREYLWCHGPWVRQQVPVGWDPVYRDPYRCRVYGKSLDIVADLSEKISACFDDGLAAADVVILTLGLTEVWRDKSSGLYVCEAPKLEVDPAFSKVEFKASRFSENYENLVATIDLIRSRYPDKKIVITVSPVALARTWTNQDVVVANQVSKSTLRAVVAQVCSENPDVIYWPSYEFAQREDIYKEDGLHVRPEAVARIVNAFIESHTA